MAAPLSTASAVARGDAGRAARISARMLWSAAVVGCCLAAALVATWPLALFFASSLPLGTEHEATVPLASLWALWWTADRAAHGFAGLWDAPLFYPNQGVLAYSEPQLLGGLLSAPLWAAGAPPALIYNTILLALLVLNGVFAYRLARALEAPPLAALLAGMLTVTLPYVAKVSGVLPIIGLFGMLWTLEGLVRFGRTGSRRWALWAAGGFIVTFLTCQQYALIFTPFALLAGVFALAQQQFRRSSLARLALAGLAAGGVVLLLALPALAVHRQMGFQRSAEVVAALSATPADLLSRPETALFGAPTRSRSDTGGLFPGAVLLLLSAAGLAAGIRSAHGAWRRWSIYFAASALLALLLALGLNLTLAGWQPFSTLRQAVPGLDQLRTPYRFVAVMQLSLPILAALAFARLAQRLPKAAGALMLGLALLAAAENLALPAQLSWLPESPRAQWTTWLRSRPADTAIAHIPFPSGVHVSAYEREGWRMFAQIDHRRPLVNGYSSYFPQTVAPDGSIIPSYTQFQLAMAELFPDRRLLCVLDQALGVDLLVIERNWLAGHKQELAAFQQFLELEYSGGPVQIYALAAPPGECSER